MRTPSPLAVALACSVVLTGARPAAAQGASSDVVGTWERLTDSVHVWRGSVRRDSEGRFFVWTREVPEYGGLTVSHYRIDCGAATPARTPVQVITKDGYRDGGEFFATTGVLDKGIVLTGERIPGVWDLVRDACGGLRARAVTGIPLYMVQDPRADARWYPIARYGSELVIRLDTETIRRGPITGAWVKFVYRTPQTTKAGKVYTEVLHRMEAQCADSSIRLVSVSLRHAGAVIETADASAMSGPQYTRFAPPEPESPGERVVRGMCAKPARYAKPIEGPYGPPPNAAETDER